MQSVTLAFSNVAEWISSNHYHLDIVCYAVFWQPRMNQINRILFLQQTHVSFCHNLPGLQNAEWLLSLLTGGLLYHSRSLHKCRCHWWLRSSKHLLLTETERRCCLLLLRSSVNLEIIICYRITVTILQPAYQFFAPTVSTDPPQANSTFYRDKCPFTIMSAGWEWWLLVMLSWNFYCSKQSQLDVFNTPRRSHAFLLMLRK